MGLHSRRERQEILREIRRRRDGAAGAFLRRVELPDDVPDEALGHAADVPAARALRGGLDLDPRVTFLVGENGSGKSTVAEAIAVAMGLNAEGGGRHLRHATRESHSGLGDRLRTVRGTRGPQTDFFLRAESVFTVATALDAMADEPGDGGRALRPYGGRSLHEQSHGESFLALVHHRLGPEGFYVLDEPESALSPQNVLVLARRIVELADQGSQFVVATHSPLLLLHVPGATVLRCDEDGIAPTAAADAPAVELTRRILAAPEAYVRRLVGGADPPGGGFVRELLIRPDRIARGGNGSRAEIITPGVWQAVRSGLALHPAVTFLTGENGAGKSTLAEAIAVAMGMNAEGGTLGWWFQTRMSHSDLGHAMLVVRGTRRTPQNRFFVRGESVFTLATALESGANRSEGGLEAYGDRSLHERSHGEALMALALHRLGPAGFYVLDEPEAALSPQTALALLHRIDELVGQGSQLVIATHSPILLAYPHATILRVDREGVVPVDYAEAGTVVATRGALGA